MSDAIDNCLITDSQDLKYISEVVGQALDNWQSLANIRDLQKAITEISLERERQLQINLVFEENQLIGFNFSFKIDPKKTTDTISLQQQDININLDNGSVIPYQQLATTIEIKVTEPKGNLAIPSSSPNEIILTPGLQVESKHIINQDDSETQEILKSPSPGFGKISPALTNAAHQLANQHEVNGLLLTGLTVKTGISTVNTLQPEDKPDIQTSGLAIIKRLQQVLPQEFIDFQYEDSPSTFNWKDSVSNRQYHFRFEVAQISEDGDVLKPAVLQGFDCTSGSDSMQPVFNATLINAKYNRWSIEQCDFNKNQIQSLNLANKTTPKSLAIDNFTSEI
jgi:hypothetical protein